MASFNKVILAGNLTRDVELRFTPKGTPIAQFSLAVNRAWKDDAGNKKEEVSFIDCKCFGKQAETISEWFKKGRPILIEGRLNQETWDDKETKEKRSKLVVIVEGFSFIGENKKSAEGKPAPTPAKGEAADEGDDVPY